MSYKSAIMSRQSRRSYKKESLDDRTIEELLRAVKECNSASNLKIEMITDDKYAFGGLKNNLGLFTGVRNYFVMIGNKEDPDVNEKIGYYGESLVLLVTELGLGSCWVAATYDKNHVASIVGKDEYIKCIIAFGNVKDTQNMREKAIRKAIHRKDKEIKDMLVAEEQPENWVINGMRCVVKAPSTRNRQPVKFYYSDNAVIAKVKNENVYEQIDLGIAKLHFEIGAGKGRWDFGNGGIFEYEKE